MNYAGDVTSKQCWGALSSENSAQLVDVRTMAEWSFVGVPDLSSLGKKPILSEWQSYPSMEVNLSFCDQVIEALERKRLDKDTTLYFLCRSGARSRSSAIAMTAKGYSRCFNVADGFEGDPNAENHRNQVNGWKHANLPWGQS